MSTHKKGELVFIIVLLAIFVPGMLLGILGKVQGLDKKDKNQENADKGNNPLVIPGIFDIVDNTGNYLGTYYCQEKTVYCGLAYETLDDVDYSGEFYNDGSIDKLPIISNNYVFIVDSLIDEEYYRNSAVILYNVGEAKEVARYEAVKNYTIGIEDNLFIVKKDGKWGIIKIDNTSVTDVLTPTYDYIGLVNDIDEATGTIVSEKFVAMNGGAWSIIDRNGARLFGGSSNEIVNYDEHYFITLNNSGKQLLYSYQGTQLLDGNVYNKIIFVGRYVGLFDNSNQFYIYDQVNNVQISPSRYNYVNTQDVSLEYQENKVSIKINGQVVASNILV